MLTPGGYFCTKCPSVVIDQELIRTGISDSRFEYHGVLGIDYGKERDPDFFETWNGEETIYIFDEDQMPLRMRTLGRGIRGAHASQTPSKKKNRNKKK